VLALISGIRLVAFRQPIDWLTVALVVIAAVAAIAHRNAVVGLEARGRGEAESFARILHGLSRSVSAEAIVSAILDDLIDATNADHVVLVRRRPDVASLEATLVTRRAGVPHTTTSLPLSLLDPPGEPNGNGAGRAAVPSRAPVAVGPGVAVAAVGAASIGSASGGASGAELPPVGPAPAPAVRPPAAEFVLMGDDDDDTAGHALDPFHQTGSPERDTALAGHEAPGLAADAAAGPPAHAHDDEAFDALIPRPPVRVRVRREVARRGARRASDTGLARAILRRAAAESLALLTDLGLPAPDLFGSRGRARPAEVLARGDEALITERVASRVHSAFGLSHTLTAPLRSDGIVIGAIVLSRRDGHAWPEGARRLLRAAASETASALERANTYREATAGAATDPLTGLPNRRYFDEFSTLLAGRRRSGDAVAILMIDIDRFKVLNDTFGHPTGDQVLRAVATAITTAVRDEDVPARMGGEEFAVLLRNPGPDVALEVGERVRQAVRDLDLRQLGVPGVSVSVGVAGSSGPDEPIDALVDRADRALLRAKRAGRDQVVAG
jgi:diguanylate cyclase (GGDEF)-like protein